MVRIAYSKTWAPRSPQPCLKATHLFHTFYHGRARLHFDLSSFYQHKTLLETRVSFTGLCRSADDKMAGAEAIAAISLVAACITIIEKITSIGDAVHDAQGLPSKLRLVFEKLPVIEELLNKARERFENENISEATSERAQPVLEQCKQALEKLRNIFQDACPEDEENRRK